MKSWPPDILANLCLYPLALDDTDDLMLLERGSFSQPWSRELMAAELQADPNIRLGARWKNRRGFLAGYLFLWLVADEAQVHTIACHPALRGQGIAVCLLGAGLRLAWQKGALWANLEVRPSNLAARRLYAKFGVKEAGRRKNYYSTPQEDALLFNAPLDGSMPLIGGLLQLKEKA